MDRCPRCHHPKLWKLRSGKYRCARCKTSVRPRVAGLAVSNRIARAVITEFVLEHSTNVTLERVPITKYKLLPLLTALRIAMTRDIPPVFSGTVEVDETYVGGKWQNKRLSVRRKTTTKRGRGTSKQPVFGILCRGGTVWAEVVANVEASDLQPRIEERVRKGTTVCSDGWRAYTGIAAKGYVHRLVEHSEEYSDGAGNHINGLEGFWGYLKRKLAAKGGIRRERLPIYLGEYVWRYNHRHLSLKEREKKLFQLLTGVRI